MVKKICRRCGKTLNQDEKCDCRKKYDTSYKNKRTNPIYHTKAWTICSETAKERDHGLCLMCWFESRFRPSSLAHHIIEVVVDISKAFDLLNLICLCNKCHGKVHAEYNKGDKERKAMQRYLYEILDRWIKENK